jgi:hypothetical protein
MRIPDVGNTAFFTRDHNEYILSVNDTSQVDMRVRSWVARVGMGDRVIAVQIRTGQDRFPRFILVVALFFGFVPRGIAQLTSTIGLAVY